MLNNCRYAVRVVNGPFICFSWSWLESTTRCGLHKDLQTWNEQCAIRLEDYKLAPVNCKLTASGSHR